MWRIKRRRTKPIENKAKTGVIYPKLNATFRPNRYHMRNTYLDVKCNKELGAGCTDIGCQSVYSNSIWPISFDLYVSDGDLYATGAGIGRWTIVDDLWVRSTLPSDRTKTPYNPVYKGPNDTSGNPVYMTFGYDCPTSSCDGPALPIRWNIFRSTTFNVEPPGTTFPTNTGLEWLVIFDTVQAFITPTSYRYASINNGLTNPPYSTVSSLTVDDSTIKKIFTWTGTNAGATVFAFSNLVFDKKHVHSCKTAPYRNPILGYRKHLIDCSGNIDLSGCGYTKDVSGNVYKDNYAKTCATHPEACYNQVIRPKQNKNGCVNESYNYSTNQYFTRRCMTFKQQEFNFLSQTPVDASGCCTKFKSCNNCQYNTDGDCDCSSNGFCTGINKLPCEVKNTKCFAIYKRSNSKFNRQGAVSGGSRINRLKYQTRMKAQGRTVNGRNNIINRREPAALYRTSRPQTFRADGCWLNKNRTKTGLAQRCIVTDPCCPSASGSGGSVGSCWTLKYPSAPPPGITETTTGLFLYVPMPLGPPPPGQGYSGSDCGGVLTTNYPSLIVELGGGGSGGWISCGNTLTYPNNFIIYDSGGGQIAGGASALPGGNIIATVANINPLQLILEITSWQGGADPFTLMPGGTIRYDTAGGGGNSENPPICDSDEFNIVGT